MYQAPYAAVVTDCSGRQSTMAFRYIFDVVRFWADSSENIKVFDANGVEIPAEILEELW